MKTPFCRVSDRKEQKSSPYLDEDFLVSLYTRYTIIKTTNIGLKTISQMIDITTPIAPNVIPNTAPRSPKTPDIINKTTNIPKSKLKNTLIALPPL